MNGVLLVDKPAGKTSYDMVNIVKRAAGVKKVGHTGTLDPMATGVLPVCINEATKLVQFLILHQKEYRATMLFGIGTDTYDISGEIIDQVEPAVSEAAIRTTLEQFLGRIEQKPPRFSALKYKGKPMYKWARQGVLLDPPARSVEISRLEIVAIDLPYLTFDVTCSKGTYIRSLCHDIGERLNCPACLTDLRRTRSGHFVESQTVSIDGLAPGELSEIIADALIPMSEVLVELPTFELSDTQTQRVRNGHPPDLTELQEADLSRLQAGETIKLMDSDRQLLALARFLAEAETKEENGAESRNPAIKILRVFNN